MPRGWRLMQMVETVIAECWIGCDWDTTYGDLQLNLNGMTADNAEDRARRYAELAAGSERPTDPEIHEIRRAAAGLGGSPARAAVATNLAETYGEAASYLQAVERDAREAFGHVKEAAVLAVRGDARAADVLDQAIEIERRYHRAPIWLPLRPTFQQAAAASRRRSPQSQALIDASLTINDEEQVVARRLQDLFDAHLRKVRGSS